MPRSRLSPFFSVLLVFLSGAAVGALVHRLYVVKSVAVSAPAPPNRKLNPEEVRKRLVSRMREAIKLDDRQVAELQKVFDEEGDAYLRIKRRFDADVDPIKRKADAERDALHDEHVAKVKAFLRPDQQPLYDKWRAERTAERAADKKRHQQQQQGGIKQQ